MKRSIKDSVIAGVCGAIAKELHIDPVWIRLIWAILFLFYGVGLLAYLLCWIIIPKEKL